MDLRGGVTCLQKSPNSKKRKLESEQAGASEANPIARALGITCPNYHIVHSVQPDKTVTRLKEDFENHSAVFEDDAKSLVAEGTLGQQQASGTDTKAELEKLELRYIEWKEVFESQLR